MTNRLVAYVIDKLRYEASFTSVAKEVNLSLPTVIRIFDLVSYSLKNCRQHFLLMNSRAIQAKKSINVF